MTVVAIRSKIMMIMFIMVFLVVMTIFVMLMVVTMLVTMMMTMVTVVAVTITFDTKVILYILTIDTKTVGLFLMPLLSLFFFFFRSNIPPNHVPSNASLVGQSPQVNPSSIQNPLQDIAASMNTNPHTISSIIGLQNNVMQNKPLKVHGVFPGGLGTFSGLPQQFAGQPAVHRNTATKGNLRLLKYATDILQACVSTNTKTDAYFSYV